MHAAQRQSLCKSLWKRLRNHRTALTAAFLAVVVLPVAALLWSDHICQVTASGHIFRSVADVPQNDVALVLGTGKFTPRGLTNLHFTQRMETAARLFQAGKVRHLIVSGDNHTRDYDEPTDMRDALVASGVPTNAITCDYAGFRTLDSVLRANSVFGLSRFTIVTEEFHCPRAVWIARARGLDAIAFAAPDLTSRRWTVRVKIREALAQVRCGLDLYLLHTEPKFPGPAAPLNLTASNP